MQDDRLGRWRSGSRLGLALYTRWSVAAARTKVVEKSVLRKSHNRRSRPIRFPAQPKRMALEKKQEKEMRTASSFSWSFEGVLPSAPSAIRARTMVLPVCLEQKTRKVERVIASIMPVQNVRVRS